MGVSRQPQGELARWEAQGLGAADAEIAAITKLHDPRVRSQIMHPYEQSLEPVSCVVCGAADTLRDARARIVVHAGQVTTVHLSKRYGPSRLGVYEPAH